MSSLERKGWVDRNTGGRRKRAKPARKCVGKEQEREEWGREERVDTPRGRKSRVGVSRQERGPRKKLETESRKWVEFLQRERKRKTSLQHRAGGVGLQEFLLANLRGRSGDRNLANLVTLGKKERRGLMGGGGGKRDRSLGLRFRTQRSEGGRGKHFTSGKKKGGNGTVLDPAHGGEGRKGRKGEQEKKIWKTKKKKKSEGNGGDLEKDVIKKRSRLNSKRRDVSDSV